MNNDLIKHAENGDWGLYRNTRLTIAEILRKKTRWKPALSTYLEVCYLDLNGPNNSGIPFSSDEAMLFDGVLNSVFTLMSQLNLSLPEIQNLFDKVAKSNYQNLRLPVSPKQAWKIFEQEMKESSFDL